MVLEHREEEAGDYYIEYQDPDTFVGFGALLAASQGDYKIAVDKLKDAKYMGDATCGMDGTVKTCVMAGTAETLIASSAFPEVSLEDLASYTQQIYAAN